MQIDCLLSSDINQIWTLSLDPSLDSQNSCRIFNLVMTVLLNNVFIAGTGTWTSRQIEVAVKREGCHTAEGPFSEKSRGRHAFSSVRTVIKNLEKSWNFKMVISIITKNVIISG